MSAKNLLFAGLLGGVVAAVGNYIVYFIARMAGVEFVGQSNGPTVEQLLIAIGVSSILPGLVAALMVLGLSKLMARPLRVFIPASVLLALVSMVPPMRIPGAPLEARVALALMHIVAAGAILGAIALRSRRTESAKLA